MAVLGVGWMYGDVHWIYVVGVTSHLVSLGLSYWACELCLEGAGCGSVGAVSGA